MANASNHNIERIRKPRKQQPPTVVHIANFAAFVAPSIGGVRVGSVLTIGDRAVRVVGIRRKSGALSVRPA